MAFTFTSYWIIKSTSCPVQPLCGFHLSKILPALHPPHRRSHSFLVTLTIPTLDHRSCSFLSYSLWTTTLKLAQVASLGSSSPLISVGLLPMCKPILPAQVTMILSIFQYFIIPRSTCLLPSSHLHFPLLPLFTQDKLAVITEPSRSICPRPTARTILMDSFFT